MQYFSWRHKWLTYFLLFWLSSIKQDHTQTCFLLPKSFHNLRQNFSPPITLNFLNTLYDWILFGFIQLIWNGSPIQSTSNRCILEMEEIGQYQGVGSVSIYSVLESSQRNSSSCCYFYFFLKADILIFIFVLSLWISLRSAWTSFSEYLG